MDIGITLRKPLMFKRIVDIFIIHSVNMPMAVL